MLSSNKDIAILKGEHPVTRYLDRSARSRAVSLPRCEIRYARLVGILVALSAFLISFAVQARGTPDSFADLAETLTPAVVNIATSQNVQSPQTPNVMPQVPPGSPFEDLFRDFFERQQRGNQEQQKRRVTSLGSGFIVDASGYVVTNNHVIADADEITVVLNDDREFPAKLVGHDPKTDLALLKIEVGEPLPFVKFGNSDKLRVGDWVIAIGNPFGLGNTVTAGIISARSRDINAGPYDDFLQTDAPINRGNSGGPLFNMEGKVIGINTAIFSPSGGSVGIGFSVPSALAEPVVNQLREFGRTKRGWLGVRIQTVTDDIAESLGLDKARGALVADVTPESPAAVAGIETGDVILRFNGEDITLMRDLPRVVANAKIADPADVEFLRKGKKMTVKVTIGELEEEAPVVIAAAAEPEPATAEAASLGMTLATIGPDQRERFGLSEGTRGVVVTEVVPGGAAAERGIRPGDVVLEVGLEEVMTPADVVDKITEASNSSRKSVLLLVDRGGDQRFIAVEINQG